MHFRCRIVQRLTAAGLQNLSQCRKTGRIFVPDIPAEQNGCGDLGTVFPRQLAQLCRHLLCAREQAQIARDHRGAVVAKSDRDRRQSCQHRAHETLFRGVEGIELVNEDRTVFQKSRQLAPCKGIFEPCRRQFEAVGRVHASMRQQGLIALENQRQLCQLAALRAAVLRKGGQLVAGQACALQLVDGLGRHLTERRTPAVAVVIVDIVL